MARYWLMKSEPGECSIDDALAAPQCTVPWTGVRNFMARNYLRAMKKGDRAFFYHSNIGKEIVGIVQVAREAYPDPIVEPGEKGDWSCVDMKAVGPVKTPVTLAQLKANPAFAEFPLIRQSRLSVMPVSEEHWIAICTLAGVKP